MDALQKGIGIFPVADHPKTDGAELENRLSTGRLGYVLRLGGVRRDTTGYQVDAPCYKKKEGTLQSASHLGIFINAIPQLVLVKHDSLKLGRSVGPTVSCMINGCSCGLLFIYREINSNMGEKSAFSIHRGTSLYLFSINKCIDHSPYRD